MHYYLRTLFLYTSATVALAALRGTLAAAALAALLRPLAAVARRAVARRAVAVAAVPIVMIKRIPSILAAVAAVTPAAVARRAVASRAPSLSVTRVLHEGRREHTTQRGLALKAGRWKQQSPTALHASARRRGLPQHTRCNNGMSLQCGH